MRYERDVDQRQHSKEHIIDLINLYCENINKLFEISDKFKFEVFVMEKPDINIKEDKTKDGIHLIFGVSCHKAAKLILRKIDVKELKEMWSDLPLINSGEDLIDEGVTRGSVNWQMYGSKKPDNLSYSLKYHFHLEYSSEKREWKFTEDNIEKFDFKKNLKKLSVHCDTYPKLMIHEDYLKDYENSIENLTKRKKSKLVSKSNQGKVDLTNMRSVSKLEDIDNLITDMLEHIETSNTLYELKETYQFTMLLPEKYWGSGSYDKWIRVGWALKNTNVLLLPVWLKFSSQSKEFKITDVNDLIDFWDTFDHDNPDGLTSRSIMFWAKNDNQNEYYKVRAETISYFIEQTITHVTEWDFAQVLYQMCKDEFVCVSIKNNIWYEYINHRWYEIDSGNTLRLIISKRMHDMYMKKTTDAVNALQQMDQSDDNYEVYSKRTNK